MDNSNVVRVVKPTALMFRNESAKSLLGLAFVGAAAIEGVAVVIVYKIVTKARKHYKNKHNDNSTD
ncbi:MAG: hypothetical protein NC215_00495 [Ruminococcus sp.]|nr:hypothetical protein [Ruminococcus sp.]MCM1391771.1 hypothetical protein [Ruminococcus sp.]